MNIFVQILPALLAGAFTLIIQGLMLAFFLGRIQAAQTAFEGNMTAVKASIAELTAFRLAVTKQDGEMTARMLAFEEAAKMVRLMRDEFIAFKASQEAVSNARTTELQMVRREVHNVSAQLANMKSGTADTFRTLPPRNGATRKRKTA